MNTLVNCTALGAVASQARIASFFSFSLNSTWIYSALSSSGAVSLLKRIEPSGLIVTADLLRLLTKSTTIKDSKIDI